MALGVEIGTLLDREPGIRGGRPKYSHLTLAQVHAALAYYHANREEIEADIALEEKESAHWEQQLANDPKRR